MKVGWVGLGKLGLPCALALASFGGHEVYGYDASDTPLRILSGELKPHHEELLPQLISQYQHGTIRFTPAASMEPLAADCDLVIIAVQTPHDPSCDGTRPMPRKPKDFDYGYLKAAVTELAKEASLKRRMLPAVVLSTVLPGTMEREIAPLAGIDLWLAYSPAFISLGSTVRDFTRPDFHLAGTRSARTLQLLRELYQFTGRPVLEMDVASAELAKMACNMMDTVKITMANYFGELAQIAGADADAVTATVARHKSDWFPSAGMPDGGPCRPRDLIALSHMSRRPGLVPSSDAAQAIGLMRQEHARRIAEGADAIARELDLPVVLAGVSYKPESDLAVGSPALLVAHYLQTPYTPWNVPAEPMPPGAAVFVICTRYDQLRGVTYPAGSAVLDPWGITREQPSVAVIRPGRR